MTIASIGQKIIAFVYFTIVARSLGAEATGQYVTALAFSTIFVVFVDLGMTNVLVREAAKYKDKIQQYFSVVLISKLFLAVASYIVLFIAANALGYDIALRHLIYLSGITMLFDSLHLSVYGVLRAIGDLKYEALGIVTSQAATLIIGGLVLYFNLPILFLILAFTIPSFLNATYSATVLYKKYKIKLLPKFDREVFIYLGKIIVPFALAAIFARVYSYIDTIILSKLASSIEVGWYSIPYKITFAFQFIPLALVAALYPKMSEYFVKDKKQLALIFQQGMKYLMVIVFPIVVGIGVLSEDIILTFYKAEYTNSILPLKILISGLIFSYLSFPIGAMLNACNKQVTQTIIIGFVMIVNITLNFLLIPHYGIIGASIAALVGNALLTLIGYSIIPKITKVSHIYFIKTLLQLIIAGGIMGLLVYYTNQVTHFTVAIAVGAATYPIMLFITRALTINQIKESLVILKR